MEKLKRADEVDKTALIKHRTMLILEGVMALVSLCVLVYQVSIGDPNGRFAASIGTICAFLAPMAIEWIFKIRFAPLAHLIFTIFATLSIFCGSTLNFHNTVGPYDEIMHFLLGYMSCLFFFYVMISWKDYRRQSPLFVGMIIFVSSMGIAALWEILEFSMDVLIGQTSIGAPDSAVVEQGIALGYSGIQLQIYGIMHGVGVWDTITDMALHLCGNILFMIEFTIHVHIKRPLILGYIEKDYYINRKAFYNDIGNAEPSRSEVNIDETDIAIENNGIQ